MTGPTEAPRTIDERMAAVDRRIRILNRNIKVFGSAITSRLIDPDRLQSPNEGETVEVKVTRQTAGLTESARVYMAHGYTHTRVRLYDIRRGEAIAEYSETSGRIFNAEMTFALHGVLTVGSEALREAVKAFTTPPGQSQE